MEELLINIPGHVKIDDLFICDIQGEWTTRYWSELENTSCKSIDDVEYENVCVFGDNDDVCIVLDNLARIDEKGVCSIGISVYIMNIDRMEYGRTAVPLSKLNKVLIDLCKEIDKEIETEVKG